MIARSSFLHYLSVTGAAIALAFAVSACGSSGSGDSTSSTPTGDDLQPPAARSVVGVLDSGAAPRTSARSAAASLPVGTSVTLDEDASIHPLDGADRFELLNVADGDHSLFVHLGTGGTVEVPFRMHDGQGLNLGTVTVRDGEAPAHTGFDGYHFGFVDEDGDGVNDLFADADGDGICDTGTAYAGAPYLMDHGYADADGDGSNDDTGMPYGHGFGWVDADGDGVNDAYADANADGVNDSTGHGYTMGFGQGGSENHMHGPIERPAEPPVHGGGPMMGGGMS